MCRLLLICLLAIALPLKTLAAVAMVGCGPVHHGAGSAQASDADVHHAHHGSHAPGTGTGAEPDAGGDAAKHPGAKMPNAKCSSCAPCCAAAAPAPDAHHLASAEPASAGVPAPSAAYRGVVADVPHKPPRSLFA